MGYNLRVIIEKVNAADNQVISRDEIAEYKIEKAKTILDIGLRHSTQVQLLKKVQDALLKEQSILFTADQKKCPKCGELFHRNGYKASDFHAVFSDHRLKVQRLFCKNCGESVVESVKSLFGTSIHPDLYKLQCELGANHSYLKSESHLTALCQEERKINNRQRIKKIANAVGQQLEKKKIRPHKITKEYKSAAHLTVQIDGGHIKNKVANKGSFEALSAKIYKPESVVASSKGHTHIIEKSCAASAKDDKQKTMKKLVQQAAKKQGMTKETAVTVLADGAKNCWNVAKSLMPLCASLLFILDWFHIAKKFQTIINISAENEHTKFTLIKEQVWCGEIAVALQKLEKLKLTIENEKLQSKINGLYGYLKRNKERVVNYKERAKNKLIYTSHVAESTVEHLINDRYKRKQKMQWTREGAHNLLQIRASIASNDWVYEWEDIIMKTIQEAA
jgi:ribosomal protein S27AE